MKARFLKIISLLFLAAMAYSYTDRDYERVENLVFGTNKLEAVRGFMTDGSGIGTFQNALVHYRIGSMTTNVEHIKKSIALLAGVLSNGTNVFPLAYYGIAHSGLSLTSPNPLEKADGINKALSILNNAVSLYPAHYLPRFYRGILLLYVPGFLGGNEDQGVKDMEFVMKQVPTLKRDPDFKAFLYMFYGLYWGEKKKNYSRALPLMQNSLSMALNTNMITNILKYKTNYEARLQK